MATVKGTSTDVYSSGISDSSTSIQKRPSSHVNSILFVAFESREYMSLVKTFLQNRLWSVKVRTVYHRTDSLTASSQGSADGFRSDEKILFPSRKFSRDK